jgi:hypothetical protein
MTPMRANIVGPPSVATRIQGLPISRLPLRGLMNGLRKLGDIGAGVLQGDELAARRKHDRLVDNPRLVNQIAAPERRTSRGGKDSIDHAPGAHDDLANVVAGVAYCAVTRFTSSVSEALDGARNVLSRAA